MKLADQQDWNMTPKEAIAVQRLLGPRIEAVDRLRPVRLVAGVDVSLAADRTSTTAAVAVLSFPKLEIQEHAVARCETHFPYIPGLLSFRECPAVLAALQKLRRLPDLILVDGQGLAHPRRFGLASHLGLLLDLPTIGVAKSRLVGEHGELPAERGAWVPLTDHGEVIGAVLCTRQGVRPVYVSTGHRISLATAIQFVLRTAPRYRLPETTRQAHRLSSGHDALRESQLLE